MRTNRPSTRETYLWAVVQKYTCTRLLSKTESVIKGPTTRPLYFVEYIWWWGPGRAIYIYKTYRTEVLISKGSDLMTGSSWNGPSSPPYDLFNKNKWVRLENSLETLRLWVPCDRTPSACCSMRKLGISLENVNKGGRWKNYLNYNRNLCGAFYGRMDG